MNLCEDVQLNGSEKATMLRLWDRGLQSVAWEDGMVPLRVWRAFYRRHPDAMLESQDPAVRARGQQFEAEDDATAAGKAFDDAVKGRA